MSWLSGLTRAAGTEEGRDVLSSFISEFYKNSHLAASPSCLLLGILRLIRKEVVVDLIKVFQWRVEEGRGWREGSEVKTGRTGHAGHYYFAL